MWAIMQGLSDNHVCMNSSSLVCITLPREVMPVDALRSSVTLRRFSAALARPSWRRFSVASSAGRSVGV